MECSGTAEEAETRSCAAGLESVFLLVNGGLTFPLLRMDISLQCLCGGPHRRSIWSAVGFGQCRYRRDFEVWGQYTKPSRCSLRQAKLRPMRSQARAAMQVASWILRMSSFLHLVPSVGIAVLPAAPNRQNRR